MAYYHHYKAPPARRGSSSSLSKGRGSTTLPGEPATEYEGHNKSSYPLYPANDIPSLQHTSTQDYMYSNIFKFGVKPPPPSQLHTTTITYKTPPQPKQAADYIILHVCSKIFKFSGSTHHPTNGIPPPLQDTTSKKKRGSAAPA